MSKFKPGDLVQLGPFKDNSPKRKIGILLEKSHEYQSDMIFGEAGHPDTRYCCWNLLVEGRKMEGIPEGLLRKIQWTLNQGT